MKLLTTKLLAALAATLLLQSSAHALVKRPHQKGELEERASKCGTQVRS